MVKHLDLGGGFILRLTAVDPTTGNTVTGVKLSNVVLTVDPISGAVDTSADLLPAPIPVSTPPSVLPPPPVQSQPVNVTYTVSGNSITLKWQAVPGAVGYEFLRDGARVSNTWDGTVTTVTFSIPQDGEPHTFEVVALTVADRGSVTYTPTGAPPPPPPNGSILHEWDPPYSPDKKGGGTPTPQQKAPGRVSNVTVGDKQFTQLQTLPGDTNVAGSGNNDRCDLLAPNGLSEPFMAPGATSYFTMWVYCDHDYHPAPGTNFQTIGYGWHRNAGGYPGGVHWLSYCATPTGGGNDAEWNPANIVSGSGPYQVGGAFIELYGGQWLDVSNNPVAHGVTPHYLNTERWPILPPGFVSDSRAWEIAYGVHASANLNELGSKFYKDNHGGTGTPADPSTSGWLEIQLRGWTLANGVWTSGPWQWYDGGTIAFKDGGRQVWANGPEPHRHYRPTLFYYNDVKAYDRPYWKMGHNYHPDSPASVVRVRGHKIGTSFAAFGGLAS